MPENPRPNGKGPRVRPEFGEPTRVPPADGSDPVPEQSPLKSRPPRGGKLRLISLITIPIAAAACAAYFNPPQYGGGASLRIEDSSSAITGKPIRRATSEVLASIRSVFLESAWTEAKNRDDMPPLELDQTPAKATPSQKNPPADAVIQVVSTDRQAIQSFITAMDRRFQTEYEAMKTRETERQESQRLFLEGQILEFSTILESLILLHGKDIPNPMDASVAGGLSDGDSEFGDPQVGTTSWSLNEGFRRHWKRLHRTRSRYMGQRMELLETQRQLDELLQTPPPATAIIEPEDRAKAYNAHTVLNGDLSQLKDHLEDVRRAMSKIYSRADHPLQQVLESLKTIKECAKGSDASKLSSEKRLALDRLSETTTDLDLFASGFAQDWNGGFTILANQPIDPAKHDVLDFHDEIATKASDYGFKAGLLIDKLKLQLRAFSEAGSDSAKGHFQTATLTREINALADSQARFIIAANALRDPNEFLLDAALRSSRGLSQRSSLIIKEIEEVLEVQARQRAFDERQRKIDSLTKSVGILRTATDEIAGTMIETLSKMQDDKNDTNTYLDQVFELETTSAKRQFLEQQINRIQVQLKEIEENPAALQFPKRVAVDAHFVSKRPKNLVNLITAILAAWGTCFIGVLGISRMARRN